jgi:hypothetical protein
MRTILLLGVALSLAACGSDAPVGPTPTNVAGTYQLTTFDGNELPVTVVDLGAYRIELTAGTLALDAGGGYSMDFDLRILDSGNTRSTADHASGTWTADGQTITLVDSQSGSPRGGTISGDTVTLENITLVFVRRR